MTNLQVEPLSKYISFIHRSCAAYLSREFRKFNIGSGQYMFLIKLYKNDGLTQEQLTEMLNIDKGTTTKAVKKLEEVGLVTRAKDENDKRINRIYLTRQALDIKEEFLSIISNWEDALTATLSEEEKNDTLIILKKITNNIINK